jgi:hypothetical protein
MRKEDEAMVAARDARVQLQRVEIRQIVRGLRRFERCRVLVFGTGSDSPVRGAQLCVLCVNRDE